jgi:type III pantothenate kinase
VWLLDLGNTRLKLARSRAEGMELVTALAHDDVGFDAQLLQAMACASDGEPAVAWLASVAPAGVRLRVEAALEAAGLAVQRASTKAECAGVRIAYADPARLGVDRFLGLLAARARGGDQLVVSFGSAITVDLLDSHGRHHGGLIGIAESQARQALVERFPALDRGEGEPSMAFAIDTPDAVAAGTHRQALGLVLAAWDDACAALGRPPALLLGGGDAPAYADALSRRLAAEVVRSDALVIEGLRVYADAAPR